jgi:dTDP-4-dehydrorhamnose reductase
MKALVTGAKGMLGLDLCDIFKTRYELLPVDIEEMDIRHKDTVTRVFDDFKPDLVLHLAAFTDVDGNEKNPAEAYLTNSIGTRNVAFAAMKHDAELVYISTGSVFNGRKREPYCEYDVPDPLSHYAKSKLYGEQLIRNFAGRYYIVRAGWMFGGGPEDKKFVAKIVKRAESADELLVVDDKFGSPTFTRDISSGILQLLKTGDYGLYHMVNRGFCSRYEFCLRILEFMGNRKCTVKPVSSSFFPLPAPRPDMEALRNYFLEIQGYEYMRSWEEALEEYIKTTFV